jgi:hypothetical protein
MKLKRKKIFNHKKELKTQNSNIKNKNQIWKKKNQTCVIGRGRRLRKI